MYYRVVEDISRLDLAKTVEMLYANGWVAQGGISITVYGYALSYAQAMVKEIQDD